MTDIFNLDGASSALAFLIWSLATLGLARALFGSFFMEEINYRLKLRTTPKRQRSQVLHWEINHRTKFDPDVAKQSPHAAEQKLSPEQLQVRGRELNELMRVSLFARLWLYFRGCMFCQCFWASVILWIIINWWSQPIHGLLSVFAYAAACTTIGAFLPKKQTEAQQSNAGNFGQTRDTGCPGCGSGGMSTLQYYHA